MMNLEQRRALDRSAAVFRSVRERIVEQLGFAEELCDLHPDRAEQWKPLIASARGQYEACARAGDPTALEATARRIEEHLAPIGEIAKTYTMHCVGHAHIDMNWMWAWPETVAVCHDTFTTVLKLMEEFPDFCLTQSSGVIYDIVRRYSPELFEQIRQRVAEGRWEVTAAAWVEADKNLSNGESLARHLLYTRQFTAEHFGLGPEALFIQWEPDTFGHAHTIPSIVSRGGVKCYYLCRPGEQPTPPVFWFKGPDGSRVLVNRETDWYNNTIGPHGAKKLLAFARTTGLRDWMYVYGVGDHGGGPTRRDLRRRAELDSWPIYPRLKFSTARPFFEILLKHGDKWPTEDRELNFEFAGCYTSQSSIKKANRAGENMLAEAEVAATLAARAAGRGYPAARLKESWLDVLFNQFHDILPGSGVPATRQYAQGLFQNIQANAGMIKAQALRALAERIDTSFARQERSADLIPPPAEEGRGFGAGAGRITTATRPGGAWKLTDNQQVSSVSHATDGPRPVVVFNACAWERREVVTVSVWDGDASYIGTRFKDRKFIARLPDGQVLPTQVVQDGNYWDHDFLDLAVPVKVGPMAYSALAIEEVAPDAVPPAPSEGVSRLVMEKEGGWGINLPTGRLALENEHLVVEFDRKTGGISKLLDRASGRDLARADDPMGLLEFVMERPQYMSAWIPGDPRSRQFPLDVEVLRPVLEGPWVSAVMATVRVGQSKFDVTYSLRAGARQVEIDIAGQWLERGGPEIGTPKLLIRFPLNLAICKGRYEIPFGSIERDLPNGREVPALRWVDVRGQAGDAHNPASAKNDGTKPNAGACLVNDCKYGHSLEGHVLRQTLIRSSYEPDPLPEIAEHRIRLAIIPHGGDEPVTQLVRWGAGFNHALICVNTDVHDGPLPAVAESVLSCTGGGAVLDHLKTAEDGDGLILRLHEANGQAATARVKLNPILLGKVASAERVDLLERPEPQSQPITTTANGLEFALRPHEIASVRLRLG